MSLNRVKLINSKAVAQVKDRKLKSVRILIKKLKADKNGHIRRMAIESRSVRMSDKGFKVWKLKYVLELLSLG